jgi:hypothetical protein
MDRKFKIGIPSTNKAENVDGKRDSPIKSANDGEVEKGRHKPPGVPSLPTAYKKGSRRAGAKKSPAGARLLSG